MILFWVGSYLSVVCFAFVVDCLLFIYYTLCIINDIDRINKLYQKNDNDNVF